MNTVKVKICGIRTLGTAKTAVDAGADFIGFNFVKSSKRYIEPEKAREIISSLRAKRSNLKNEARSPRPFRPRDDIYMVGVFQNQPVEEVNAIADLVGLDYVQLHGEEDNVYIKQVMKPVIKRLKIKDLRLKNGKIEFKIYNSKFIILDREVQGQGDMVNMKKAKELAQQFKIFLAGGLTPENVSEIITQVRPFAVDVAGGVETNGEQDVEKIRQFIKNAKEVQYSSSGTK